MADPAEHGALTRKAIVAFGRAHAAAYEATDGRWGRRLRGKDMALVWTRGRRSGETRRTALLCVPHGDDVLVAASFFGALRHPAWFLNLRDDPRCSVRHGRRRFPATSAVAQGDEHHHLWDIMTSVWPAYHGYQERTERQIPVVRISPLDVEPVEPHPGHPLG